jgi:hypothetical protein
MILRRVIDHVKHQEWTAIVIDLVIVVLGVFIGIQVSNWNTERETNQKAAVFTARLRADLREEAWGYEYLIEYNRDVLANADRALAALSGERPLSDEQFLVSAYRASQYEFQDRRRDTFDELTSTGTISLIADPKLRRTAIMVYSSPQIEQMRDGGRTSHYRELFRRTVPAKVQHALLERCGDRLVPPLDYAAMIKSLDYPCTLGLPAEAIGVAAQALRAQDALLPTLQLRFADLETDLANLELYSGPLRDNLRQIAGRQP